MRFENAAIIDDCINTLDAFLGAGHNLYQTLLQDWEQRHAGEGYDDAVYATEKRQIIDNWHRQVCDHLKTYPNQYYLFHFINPKVPAGLHYPPYSRPVSNLKAAMQYHLYAIEEILFRLEEQQNTLVRQEIADREYDQSDLYKVTYDDHTREVRLNNIKLCKTIFDQENDGCMQYIIKNPGEISKSELKKANGNKLKKKLTHIVTGLGFVGAIRENFFPAVTDEKLVFVNPISRKYHREHNLPLIDIARQK